MFLLKRVYLLVFLFSNTLTATLYQLTTITLENGQVFYLLSDLHSNGATELNKKQLEGFIVFLKKVEQLPVKVRAFLEVLPLSVIEGGEWDPSVLTKLVEYTKDLGLKNSTLVDVDIRKFAGAVNAFIGCFHSIGSSINLKSPDTIYNSLESYRCKLDQFTLQDLLNELVGYYHFLSEYKNKCNDKKLAFVFDIRLTHCKGEIIYLKNIAEEYKVKPTCKFIELLKTILREEREHCKITDVFATALFSSATLMDLYIVSRLVKLERSNEKVIVLAGGNHIDSIASILSIAYPDARQDIISQEPLPLDELIFDKILEPRG